MYITPSNNKLFLLITLISRVELDHPHSYYGEGNEIIWTEHIETVLHHLPLYYSGAITVSVLWEHNKPEHPLRLIWISLLPQRGAWSLVLDSGSYFSVNCDLDHETIWIPRSASHQHTQHARMRTVFERSKTVKSTIPKENFQEILEGESLGVFPIGTHEIVPASFEILQGRLDLRPAQKKFHFSNQHSSNSTSYLAGARE